METSASFEARYAPSLYPTEGPKRTDGTSTRGVTLFLSLVLSRYIVPPMLRVTCRSLLQSFGIASISHLLPVLLHEKGVLCELRGECYFSS